MALDKMIKEATESGGMIDSIILDPKEALGLLMELSDLGAKYMADMSMRDRDGEDQVRKELLWGEGGSLERAKKVIQLWYKTEYEIKYKTVKLVVVKPKPKEEGWMNSAVGPLDVPNVKPPPGALNEHAIAFSAPDVPPEKIQIKQKELVPFKEVPEPHWNSPPPPPPPPPARSVTGSEPRLLITKQMMDDQLPEPPKPPLSRLIREGTIGECGKCGSSLKTKWFFFKPGGCIQPECENYWKNPKR